MCLTYSMNRCNCFSLTTLRKEIFGRLEEMEEKESSQKHRKDDGPDRYIEISPAPIVSLRATWRSRDGTGFELRTTRIICEEPPGND